MLRFDYQDLTDGVEYFCVFKGSVYYLTARLMHGEDFFSFFYEDIHGDIEEKFDAYECDLIYQHPELHTEVSN